LYLIIAAAKHVYGYLTIQERDIAINYNNHTNSENSQCESNESNPFTESNGNNNNNNRDAGCELTLLNNYQSNHTIDINHISNKNIYDNGAYGNVNNTNSINNKNSSNKPSDISATILHKSDHRYYHCTTHTKPSTTNTNATFTHTRTISTSARGGSVSDAVDDLLMDEYDDSYNTKSDVSIDDLQSNGTEKYNKELIEHSYKTYDTTNDTANRIKKHVATNNIHATSHNNCNNNIGHNISNNENNDSTSTTNNNSNDIVNGRYYSDKDIEVLIEKYMQKHLEIMSDKIYRVSNLHYYALLPLLCYCYTTTTIL
jgi:hypothetical protein